MKNYNSKKLALLLVSNIHGSGFDYDYTITENKGSILISSSYHVINDSGYYDGNIPFTVFIDKKTAKVKRLSFSCSQYHRRKYLYILRDYIEDCFFSPYMDLNYTSLPFYVRSINWNN